MQPLLASLPFMAIGFDKYFRMLCSRKLTATTSAERRAPVSLLLWWHCFLLRRLYSPEQPGPFRSDTECFVETWEETERIEQWRGQWWSKTRESVDCLLIFRISRRFFGVSYANSIGTAFWTGTELGWYKNRVVACTLEFLRINYNVGFLDVQEACSQKLEENWWTWSDLSQMWGRVNFKLISYHSKRLVGLVFSVAVHPVWQFGFLVPA